MLSVTGILNDSPFLRREERANWQDYVVRNECHQQHLVMRSLLLYKEEQLLLQPN
ncbi:MAG: hypothetical protein KME25_04275 [Symplocastrum torsivum CPER-KK1]|uniref:Uncharacterized protein n=1 Tax=Symplocastrum torsivum CPER-KK1 TaxID=450513 RepID=A0A951PIN7_9CYAN|nr:hypothetical protein [Symplocastrum torsivum CPER-KK1]